MSTTIIGADAAKLAGLQIDLLQKYTARQLLLGHLERFLNLTSEAREERFGDFKKPKSTLTESRVIRANKDGEHFECILETDYITVPDMTTVVAYAKEKWSNAIGSVTPSTVFVTGAKKKVKVFLFKKGHSSERCVEFIKQQGALLPNVFGLAIADMTVGSQLPRDKWILGFDEKESLSVCPDGDRRVPYLCLSSDGSVGRYWGYWDGDWLVVDCLVLLCD